MKNPNLQLCDQDLIEAYEATGRLFFQDILDMSWDTVLITDESCLSDFSSCGLPDELADNYESLESLYTAWDAWVLPRINERFGLVLQTTAVRLVTIFSEIEALNAAAIRH